MQRPISESLKTNPFRDRDVFDAAGKKVRGKEVFIGVEGKGKSRRLIYLDEKDLSTHTLLLGATGVGKTVLLTNVVCQFIRNGWPIFCYDFKGDEGLLKAAWTTACLCGRQKDFQLFNPSAALTTSGWTGELGSCSYNPSVSIKSGAALSNAELRAAAGKASGSVEYWAKVTEDLVKNMNAAMIGTGKAFSARDKYIALLRQDAMQLLINETSDVDARLYWQHVLAGWQSKPDEYEKSVKGTQMFYSRFGTGAFAKIMNSYTPDITAVEAYGTNKIVWNILPSMSLLSDARALAKLQLSDVLTLAGQIQSSTSKKRPCLILIDEARHAIFESFSDALAQGRSAGFWVFMGLQSISQIDQETSLDYRKELQTNLRNVICMSTGNDHASAEEFSKMFGEADMKTMTKVGDMNMSETSARNVTATDIMQMRDFQMQVRTPYNTHNGHITALYDPDAFELGVDVPKPSWEPTVDRENGLRLFERIVPEGVI